MGETATASRIAPASRNETLARRAFFGSLALGGANFARLALQAAIVPILARILGPAAVGILALAMPFVLLANLLADAGMGAALVRQADPPPALETTVFWLSSAIGAALALMLCLIAAPASRLLGQPALTGVLMALSPILILSSSLAPANARISRARRFHLYAIGDLLSVILSAGAAIVAAVAGLGAWSLVIQQLTLWGVKCLWILPASGFRPNFDIRPTLAKPLLAFGLNNVGANIADFAGRSAPALVVGATLGVIATGQYALAYQLVRIPELVISGPLMLATFTAVSALAAAGSDPAAAITRTLRLTMAVLAPLFCGLALTGDLIVDLFLGPAWRGAGPALMALAPAGVFLCLYSLIGAALMGLGRSDLQFRLALACGLAMLAGAGIGSRFGLTGAAVGVTLAAAAPGPVYLATLAARLRPSRGLLAGLGAPIAATLVMAGAVSLARDWLRPATPALQLIAVVAVGMAVYALMLGLLAGRQIGADLRGLAPSRRASPNQVVAWNEA